MTRRVTAKGQFELPMRASGAISYFTPEGERGWVPGWDPIYPAGEASESPGTVFLTSHSDVTTFWIIQGIDRAANASSYSRITPGHHAGTVEVTCTDLPDDRCLVTVEYDMTALSPNHDALDAYDQTSFDRMMQEWARLVAASL